jgi:hypothetical protein
MLYYTLPVVVCLGLARVERKYQFKRLMIAQEYIILRVSQYTVGTRSEPLRNELIKGVLYEKKRNNCIQKQEN